MQGDEMPVYTYHCDNCGIQFEKTQKFSDQPLTRCPECSKKALRKVYTPVGIVFKGSGFYSTDNRSPSGQRWASDKAADKAAEKSSEKSSESFSESSKSAESKAETPSASPAPAASDSSSTPSKD
jgi:putative FmdB family regulatory protein